MDRLYSIIDSYLASDKSTPIIVDVPNPMMLEELVTHYNVDSNQLIRSSHYCQDNETPQIDKMQHELINSAKPTFLLGLSTHLKLQGELTVKKELRRMLDMTVGNKLVILTFQCKDYLEYGDPRLMESSRIVIASGQYSITPKVIFVRESIDYKVAASVCGISQMPKFYEAIDQYPVICVSIHGQKNYNYENTKSPIHIVEELRLISSWVEKIETELVSGGIDKVIMVSDHGASRLAVINESETSLEVSEKGLHSGRCCPKADVSVKPDCATEENGFWCLANYDRFKGGRKANVEVHGGASLEEVAVPIVEITKVGKAIECSVCADSKVVTVSFKKKAELRLFVAEDSENVAIAIGGKIYQAEKTESKFYYKIPLPDIKKVGNYDFEVHVNGNVIKRGLSFEVKKEGATERKFF